MSNAKRLAKLREEFMSSNVVSLRADAAAAGGGLASITPAALSFGDMVDSIEDRLDEAFEILRGLLETATTRAEQTDLLRVLELLRR